MTLAAIALLLSDEDRFASLATRIDAECRDIAVIENTTDCNVLVQCKGLDGAIVILDAQLRDPVPILDRVRQLRSLGARVIWDYYSAQLASTLRVFYVGALEKTSKGDHEIRSDLAYRVETSH